MKQLSKQCKGITLVGLLSISSGFAYAQSPVSSASPAESPDAKHVEAARILGGEDMALAARLLCQAPRQTIDFMRADAAANPPEEPFKVFDNLYFIGGRQVTSWAIDTGEGIILLDSMNNEQDAKDYVVAGLEQMGLDPADIKLIIVLHAHGDHYGGSVYLQEQFGASIAMSDADWKSLEDQRAAPGGSTNPNWGPAPFRDRTLADGEIVSMGNTDIQIMVTPGHTLGTISVVFPVTDNGSPHMAALWGGTGQPPAGARSQLYEASLKRFADVTDEANADVILSNHPLVDGTIAKLETLKANPDGSNPFVVGEFSFKRFLSILHECNLAARAR